MTLRERLDADLKEALKARDQVRMDTIRALKSAVKYKEVEGEARTLGDDDILKVIGSLVKQRRDSVEQFRANNRPELADKEEREIGLLQAYLPQQLTPAELEALVDAAIAETGASGPKAMGPVMKAVQAKAAGRAEGKAISEVVKRRLAGS
jgi:hypothetical protein